MNTSLQPAIDQLAEIKKRLQRLNRELETSSPRLLMELSAIALHAHDLLWVAEATYLHAKARYAARTH